MANAHHTSKGDKFTQIVLKTIRLEGALRQYGEEVTKRHGLTPAKWKVLGPLLDQELTVPQLGRRMGMSRQAVQKTANTLEKEGLIVFIDNVDHLSSLLMKLTAKGRNLVTALHKDQAQWANSNGAKFNIADLDKLNHLLENFTEEVEKN